MTDSKNRYIAIGLMLFALFFGAGNLIFPAYMGQLSGTNYVPAFFGFCLTGVGMPLLAILAMGVSGSPSLQEAAGRVHPAFGVFYSVLVYLSIGPCFAMPRTGSVAFEIGVLPFLPEGTGSVAEPLFLALFFLVSLWFSVSPGKIVDRIGKILTPALVIAIGALVAASFISPMGEPAAPQAAYGSTARAVVQGALDGYNTLDAIVAFIFAVLAINFVREEGFDGRSQILGQIARCGFVAMGLLAVIYFFITKIGAESVAAVGVQETGAAVLAKAAFTLGGSAGTAVLSVIVILACLTTAIGLITCCAGYFRELTGRFSYRAWCVIFALCGFAVSTFGLKAIIDAAVPVLMFAYPIALALIILLFTDRFFESRRLVYAVTVLFTLVPALISGLQTAGVNLGALQGTLEQYVPFWTLGIGWVSFTAAGFILGILLAKLLPSK
jgi:LIVCS family branched-chain amino acid:cation transporter